MSELSEMTVSELREMAGERDLAKGGTKQELVQRLQGEAGEGAPVAAEEVPSRFHEVDLLAVKPSAVNDEWLRRCEVKVLRRAVAEGLVPCGEVERLGVVDGKQYRFRVAVRS